MVFIFCLRKTKESGVRDIMDVCFVPFLLVREILAFVCVKVDCM